MKTKLLLLICVLTAINRGAIAQKPINILFIGNSFTASHDLPNIVKQFMLADGLPVYTLAYAPGGVTVGDVAMGTAAHMNNPLVFNLIRDTEWDYLVLQDNQGRFALDSTKFPSTTSSKVIEGHIKIRDSFHYYHPCAKMIWFSGWGFEDEDTMMINKITNNYRVLNDSAKDVIAPIGAAWKQSIIEKPFFKLWSADGAHPDVTGSYLSAAVIYGTITRKDVSANKFDHSLIPADATFLKQIAQETLINPLVRIKSNLKGIEPINLIWNLTDLKAPYGRQLYRWYLNNTVLDISADSIFSPKKSGKYKCWTKDDMGNWQKSCDIEVSIPASISSLNQNQYSLVLSPNPVTDKLIIRNIPDYVHTLAFYSITGQLQFTTIKTENEMIIKVGDWAPGVYVIRGLSTQKTLIQMPAKFIKQ